MKTRSTKGFTLIELMVTIAIIGILVVVAVPAYQNFMTNAHASSAMKAVQSNISHLTRCIMKNGRCSELEESGADVQMYYPAKGDPFNGVSGGSMGVHIGDCTVGAILLRSHGQIYYEVTPSIDIDEKYGYAADSDEYKHIQNLCREGSGITKTFSELLYEGAGEFADFKGNENVSKTFANVLSKLK